MIARLNAARYEHCSATYDWGCTNGLQTHLEPIDLGGPDRAVRCRLREGQDGL